MDDPRQSLSINVHSEFYDQVNDLGESSESVLEPWQDSLSVDSFPRMHYDSAELTGSLIAKPAKVLAIQLSHPLPKTIGFSFPESPHWSIKLPESPEPSKPSSTQSDQASALEDPEQGTSPDQDNSASSTGKKTRLTPPRNLIRLEDRLYYVLQPPLESIVQNAKLTFPFQPFPYQMDGIAFLYARSSAILADEMGLGKTMQAITAIRMLLLSGEIRNALLVCPKPLVTNWMREFRQWAPEIPIAVIQGDSSKRAWVWSNPQAPVKIANYELMLKDSAVIDDGSLYFDLVLLDEAQRIKNRNSTTSEVVRSIPRSRSWALTGTPIENSVEDLVSIFEFLSPGHLRDDMHLKSLGHATRDHILRRTKDKVLKDMPPRLYRHADLDLTPEQRASYKAAEEEGVVHLADLGESVTVQHVFELVLRLKQICNFDPVTGSSCKLERLEADMEEIVASGQKAIVFSQWVSTLDVISEKLARFNPVEYHGRIASNRRDGVIDRFKNDPKCGMILMSYGAGAVGLNLQFCHYVFLFDRWWNPAVEDQAINRAHRLGVKKAVTVTRMMAVETIEQRIDAVLSEKRELLRTLFAEAGTPTNLGLNRNEIFGLFGLNVPSRFKGFAA
ncbi:MAG: DEAD/DEAH box helicase [Planctomycetota bacterium]|jgi:SNF2 family DNA or RNA helicase|nr:DEAD/DEAH box helicase [Planctomycetaceae bacterium]MCE2811867.1 DEAD/DEAH box helicase [Planctomycetaceae bacterium]